MVQRRPTTWTAVARAVVSGAHTTYAVRSVGSLRLRRTNSHRRQWGCNGAAKGSHRQSYHRGPVVPSPAFKRHKSSSSNIARSVLTCHWRPARPTYACPETVRTYAWERSSNHARSERLSPYTLSPATQAAGTAVSNARSSICRASCGLVAKGRAGGMPARAPSHVVRPRLGEIQFAIQQDVPLSTRVGQKHPNLGILHAPCRPAILPGDPSRMLAFLEKPRLIKHEHGLRVAPMLDDVRA